MNMLMKAQNKSLREVRQGLKKLKASEVEIMNLSTGEIVHECPKTRYKINLNGIGAKDTVELDIITTLANRNRKMFENHAIVITDFEEEDYSVEEIIEFLGIKDIYDGIENYDGDYIADILNKDNYDFEKFISTKASRELVERLAERAIYLYTRGKFDSHTKRRILSKALGQEDIFDVIDVELEIRDKASK